MTREVKLLKPIARTSAGLRDALFDELDGLRDGSVNATQANATAKIAGSIVDTVNMEMAAHKILSKHPQQQLTDSKLPSISLGTHSG
jgi:hypothetical protein